MNTSDLPNDNEGGWLIKKTSKFSTDVIGDGPITNQNNPTEIKVKINQNALKTQELKLNSSIKTKPNHVPTTFLDILEEPNILKKLISLVDFRTIVDLRMLCNHSNEIISTSQDFLDVSRILVPDMDAVEYFNASKVKWKQVLLGFWPQDFDCIEKGKQSYKFWEEKAPDIIELVYKIPYYLPVTFENFFEVLLPLTSLESLIIFTSLSEFKLQQNLNLKRRILLRPVFANLKHVAFEDMFTPHAYSHEAFEAHIENCVHLIKMVPLCQLETFHVGTGTTYQNDCVDALNALSTFVLESVRDHTGSLKSFRYDHKVPPYTIAEIFASERLQLESLHLDLLHTFSVFEKTKMLDAKQPIMKSYVQIKAWRIFQEFLKRQQCLKTFKIYLKCWNKKIGKKLFPENIQNTIRFLVLCIQEAESEDSFRCLSKLTSLKSLTLDVNNFPMLDFASKTNPKANLFNSIPSTLTKLMLISISYPPSYLIALVQRLTNLIELQIYQGSSMITDESTQAILQYLPGLQKLSFQPSFQLGDGGFIGKYNINRLTELRHLIVQDAKITNTTLRGISLKQLIFLNINGCKRVTHRGILKFGTNNPNVRCIYVEGMEFLPNDEKKMRSKLPNIYIFKGNTDIGINNGLLDETILEPDPVLEKATETFLNDWLPEKVPEKIQTRLNEITELEAAFKKREAIMSSLLQQLDTVQQKYGSGKDSNKTSTVQSESESNQSPENHSETMKVSELIESSEKGMISHESKKEEKKTEDFLNKIDLENIDVEDSSNETESYIDEVDADESHKVEEFHKVAKAVEVEHSYEKGQTLESEKSKIEQGCTDLEDCHNVTESIAPENNVETSKPEESDKVIEVIETKYSHEEAEEGTESEEIKTEQENSSTDLEDAHDVTESISTGVYDDGTSKLDHGTEKVMKVIENGPKDSNQNNQAI